jgi:hypothetical protein
VRSLSMTARSGWARAATDGRAHLEERRRTTRRHVHAAKDFLPRRLGDALRRARFAGEGSRGTPSRPPARRRDRAKSRGRAICKKCSRPASSRPR